jgi:hypothetical protein
VISVAASKAIESNSAQAGNKTNKQTNERRIKNLKFKKKNALYGFRFGPYGTQTPLRTNRYVPAQTQNYIKMILEEAPNFTMSKVEFENEYKKRYSFILSYDQFGFNSYRELFESLEHLVQLSGVSNQKNFGGGFGGGTGFGGGGGGDGTCEGGSGDMDDFMIKLIVKEKNATNGATTTTTTAKATPTPSPSPSHTTKSSDKATIRTLEEETIDNLKTLIEVKSLSGGIFACDVPISYKEFINKPLEYERLGYKTVYDLIKTKLNDFIYIVDENGSKKLYKKSEESKVKYEKAQAQALMESFELENQYNYEIDNDLYDQEKNNFGNIQNGNDQEIILSDEETNNKYVRKYDELKSTISSILANFINMRMTVIEFWSRIIDRIKLVPRDYGAASLDHLLDKLCKDQLIEFEFDSKHRSYVIFKGLKTNVQSRNGYSTDPCRLVNELAACNGSTPHTESSPKITKKQIDVSNKTKQSAIQEANKSINSTNSTNTNTTTNNNNNAITPKKTPEDLKREELKRYQARFILDYVVYDKDLGQHDIIKVLASKRTHNIIVSNVHNPCDIQVQLFENVKNLNSLMDELENLYYGIGASSYDMPIEYMETNRLCAAVYPGDGNWHRCKIITVYPNKSQVKVLFIDYGGYCNVQCKDVKFLSNKFEKLPVQAINAKFANLKSVNNQWNSNIINYLLNRVMGKKLQATILGCNDGVFSLQIYDQTQFTENGCPKGTMIDLNKRIVLDGQGDYYDESKDIEFLDYETWRVKFFREEEQELQADAISNNEIESDSPWANDNTEQEEAIGENNNKPLANRGTSVAGSPTRLNAEPNKNSKQIIDNNNNNESIDTLKIKTKPIRLLEPYNSKLVTFNLLSINGEVLVHWSQVAAYFSLNPIAFKHIFDRHMKESSIFEIDNNNNNNNNVHVLFKSFSNNQQNAELFEYLIEELEIPLDDYDEKNETFLVYYARLTQCTDYIFLPYAANKYKMAIENKGQSTTTTTSSSSTIKTTIKSNGVANGELENNLNNLALS